MDYKRSNVCNEYCLSKFPFPRDAGGMRSQNVSENDSAKKTDASLQEANQILEKFLDINELLEKLTKCLSNMDIYLSEIGKIHELLKNKEYEKLMTLSRAGPAKGPSNEGLKSPTCKCSFSPQEESSTIYPNSRLNTNSIEKFVNFSFLSSSSTVQYPTSSHTMTAHLDNGERKEVAIARPSTSAKSRYKMKETQPEKEAYISALGGCGICGPFSSEQVERTAKINDPIELTTESVKFVERKGQPKRPKKRRSKPDEEIEIRINNENGVIKSRNSPLSRIKSKLSMSSLTSSLKKEDSQKWNPILINKHETAENGSDLSKQEGLTSVDSILLLRQRHYVPGKNVSCHNVATSYNDNDYKHRGFILSSVDSIHLAKERGIGSTKEPSEAVISIIKDTTEKGSTNLTECSMKVKHPSTKDLTSKTYDDSTKPPTTQVLTESTNNSYEFPNGLRRSPSKAKRDYTVVKTIKTHKMQSEETIKSKTYYKRHK